MDCGYPHNVFSDYFVGEREKVRYLVKVRKKYFLTRFLDRQASGFHQASCENNTQYFGEIQGCAQLRAKGSRNTIKILKKKLCSNVNIFQSFLDIQFDKGFVSSQ